MLARLPPASRCLKTTGFVDKNVARIDFRTIKGPCSEDSVAEMVTLALLQPRSQGFLSSNDPIYQRGYMCRELPYCHFELLSSPRICLRPSFSDRLLPCLSSLQSSNHLVARQSFSLPLSSNGKLSKDVQNLHSFQLSLLSFHSLRGFQLEVWALLSRSLLANVYTPQGFSGFVSFCNLAYHFHIVSRQRLCATWSIAQWQSCHLSPLPHENTNVMQLKRITPRTCLWPLAVSLLLCFSLSIALTFRSDRHCYAGVCGEWLFPFQARLHVVVWYCWISLSVTVMALRALRPSVQLRLQRQHFDRKFPLLRKRLTTGGALMFLWVLVLYGIVTGIWWLRLQDYFATRGQEGGLSKGNTLLAAVALTGHYADVTMGMVLLPVARNSALASFFRLAASTTFAFHMIQAYVLFALITIHGLVYASWTTIYRENPSQTRPIFPLLNPTYLYNEVWPGNHSFLGVWRASLVFTGLIATLLMLTIFMTTFPAVRRNHFNVFYFTHLLSIVAVVVICLHASTMFYCTAPGLAMWILDWGMRICELSGKIDSQLEAIGNGWFW